MYYTFKNKKMFVIGNFVSVIGFSKLGPCTVIENENNLFNLETAYGIPVSGVLESQLKDTDKNLYVKRRKMYLSSLKAKLVRNQEFRKTSEGVDSLHDQLIVKNRNKTIDLSIKIIKKEINRIECQLNNI